MSRQKFLLTRLSIAALMLAAASCVVGVHDFGAHDFGADDFGTHAFGADPQGTGEKKAVPTQQPCVLLRNDNVLFGTASQQGEYVIVRRGADNEIRLPRKDVACWATSVRNLYRFRVDHRRAGDVAAMLKDARWCVRYDLYDLADQEIDAILTIAPGHSEAVRLQGQLYRKLTPVRPAGSWQDSSTVQTVSHVEEAQPDLSRVDLVALTRFAKGIQPMLLNRCGNCHDHTTDRAWTLLKPSPGTRASSRMTRENLALTLQFIDDATPESTQLWSKAVSPHGGAKAALNPRHDKAMRILRQWMLSVQSPVARSKELESSNARSDGHGDTDDASKQDAAKASDAGDAKQENAEPVEAGWPVEHSAKSDSPRRLPNVANPFDPDLFNRRYHPE